MRTTLTLEDDVAAHLERRRAQRGSSLKEEVNLLLRLGLSQADREDAPPAPPFRTETLSVGRLLLPNVDDIEAVLEQVEGHDHK